MKTIITICGIALALIINSGAFAQNGQSTTQKVKSGVKKGYHGAEKGVKKGAHEVAEQASEAKSEITDKEVESKMGPGGQDIFLSDDGRYYYVDGKGHRAYISSTQLKDKPAKNK